ncbi:gamma-secretase subunit Aph-1-like [Haemaphysalis longicornis]
MALIEYVGCCLLGFGPALSMFLLTVAGEPSRVIVFVTAAFFWLLSLLTASLAWFALVPLRSYAATGVAIAVLCQEGFRLLYFRGMRKAELLLNVVTGMDEGSRTRARLAFAYTAGLGFGAMSGVFSLLGPLADALGPGTTGLHGGSSRDLAAAAVTAAGFSVLHVFLALVSFSALDTHRWSMLAFAPTAHLAASAAMLFRQNGGSAFSVVALSAVLFSASVLAFRAAGGSARNVRACFHEHPCNPLCIVWEGPHATGSADCPRRFQPRKRSPTSPQLVSNGQDPRNATLQDPPQPPRGPGTYSQAVRGQAPEV